MKHAHLFLLMSVLATPLYASAEERVFVQVPAMVAPAASIPAAVKSQCGVETLVGNYALSAISKRFTSVQAATAPEHAGAESFVQLTVLAAAPGAARNR